MNLFLVECITHRLGEPGLNFRVLPIPYGLQQQFAQRLTFELHLAQHVKHLPTQSFPRLFQLLQQECGKHHPLWSPQL